jgi:hypothetical protein
LRAHLGQQQLPQGTCVVLWVAAAFIILCPLMKRRGKLCVQPNPTSLHDTEGHFTTIHAMSIFVEREAERERVVHHQVPGARVDRPVDGQPQCGRTSTTVHSRSYPGAGGIHSRWTISLSLSLSLLDENWTENWPREGVMADRAQAPAGAAQQDGQLSRPGARLTTLTLVGSSRILPWLGSVPPFVPTNRICPPPSLPPPPPPL